MSQEVWYVNFIEILGKKYPKRQMLIQALMDMLFIEREAVYRRLRGDVMFTALEIVKIASEWNLSLDHITSLNSGTHSFQMRNMNYINPSEQEIIILRQVIDGIYEAKKYPTTEYMDICNKLPRQVLARYWWLNQFYLFKWAYQYSNENITFAQIILSGEMIKITKDYDEAIKHVPTSNFILDNRLFDNLVSDIQYFHSIGRITDEDKSLLKQDLNDLLDYMTIVANKGCFPETQNKVNLYISHLHVDTNYNYVYMPEVNICFVTVFEKLELYSFDAEMATKFRAWMLLKKRTSQQISEVDELGRKNYFNRQRKLVESL